MSSGSRNFSAGIAPTGKSVITAALARGGPDGKITGAHFCRRRGGRAVNCAGLENRKAERPREFESHPLRVLDFERLTRAGSKNITDRHNKAAEIRPCFLVCWC